MSFLGTWSSYLATRPWRHQSSTKWSKPHLKSFKPAAITKSFGRSWRDNWLPLHFWAQFKVLILVFKAQNDFCYLPPCQFSQTDVRSAEGPPGRSTFFRSLGGGGLREDNLCGSPTLWNSLPTELCLAPSLSCFQGTLKRNLFTLAFGT